MNPLLWIKIRRYVGLPVVTIVAGLVVGVMVTGLPDRTASNERPPVVTTPGAGTIATTTTAGEPAAFEGIGATIVDLGAPEGSVAGAVACVQTQMGITASTAEGTPADTSYVSASPEADMAAQAAAALLGVTDIRLNALAGDVRIEIAVARDFILPEDC
jgi:hypothetical protein